MRSLPNPDDYPVVVDCMGQSLSDLKEARLKHKLVPVYTGKNRKGQHAFLMFINKAVDEWS